MEQKIICVKARLEAKRDGDYQTLVFKLSEPNEKILGSYFMVTKLPNWDIDIEIGQEGFVKFEMVRIGEMWTHGETLEQHPYRYSAYYIREFVPMSHVIEDGRVLSLQSPLIIN